MNSRFHIVLSVVSLVYFLMVSPCALAERDTTGGAPKAGRENSPPRMPLLMPDDFQHMKLVAWRVELGKPDAMNPLLEPAMPWDAGGIMAHGTVLLDPLDGLWKAWQVSTPAEPEFEGLEAQHENQRRLTYLESLDGVQWYRPELPYIKWPGYEKTNILLDLDSGGTAVYASVHVDPKNAEWPYEMFVLRTPSLGPDPEHVGHLPAPNEKRGTYLYRSRDGKQWQLFDGPIYPSSGGGADISYVYRSSGGSFYSYFKTYPKLRAGDRIIIYDNNPRGGLRSIARRSSPDGLTWGDESLVLVRDWRDPDFAQFLELTPLEVPGGLVGVVTYYNSATQTMSLQLAASRDGRRWWRPDRRDALPNPPLGDYGGGMIWQMHHPVVVDGEMIVYYAGSEGLHGEIFDTRFSPRIEVGNETVIGSQTPTLPFNTALMRASWDVDRLWALVPSAGGATRGEAITHSRNVTNARLYLNAEIRNGGSLRVELLDENLEPIHGHSLSDCAPIRKSGREIKLTCSGKTAALTGAVSIRFVLHRAFLYGYEWR